MRKVIIIGAGPAGLSCALELLRHGDAQVTVLEQSGAIGGISRTVRAGGCRMDIGGHRFFSKSQRVLDFWQSLQRTQGAPAYDDALLSRECTLEPGGPDPEHEDDVMLVRRRVSRIYYRSRFFDYPISLKWETLRNMGFATTMGAGFSFLGAKIKPRQELSLEDFYINRFGKKLYSMFFEDYTHKVWGRHPSRISPDWGAQRAKGLSVTAILRDMFGKALHIRQREVETSLIEQFLYPKFGPGQLWENAAREIAQRGGEVLMHHTVDSIELSEGGVRIGCSCEGERKVLEGDCVVSSMPLRDLVAALPKASVPPECAAIAENLPYRDFITVGLLVKRLNLENKTDIRTLGDIVPDCWIYVQEPQVKLGRLQIFNNWSPYMVENAQENVFLGLEYFCNEGDELWNLSDEEMADFARRELESLGLIAREDVLMHHTERAAKAYPAYFDSYEHIDTLREYLERLPNLYCIGRNGQHRYNNMDHSMLTGMLAADAIGGRADAQGLWLINTEQEYHEERATKR